MVSVLTVLFKSDNVDNYGWPLNIFTITSSGTRKCTSVMSSAGFELTTPVYEHSILNTYYFSLNFGQK